MAKANQEMENKTFGDKVKFLVTAEDSKGKLLKVEIRVKAGGQGPPEHYHPLQSETFEVVSGQLSLNANGEKSVLKPGEMCSIKPNVLHKWYNEGTEELVVIAELRPALKTENFLETMYSLDYQGKVNKEGLPGLLQFAAILNEYYGEMFVVGPPILAQKFLAKVIGGYAKLIGYKGFVPFPRK